MSVRISTGDRQRRGFRARQARRRGLAGAALFCALAASPAVMARPGDRCPNLAGAAPALQEIDAELRLAWIDEHLARTAQAAHRWTWGWGIGIGAATVANLAPLPFVAPDDRIDWYVGAATTIIGVVPLLIAPLDVVGDSRTLRLRLGARNPADDVCPLLADAEGKLQRDAKNQADGKRWWLHVGNVALNTGVGLFLGLGYHHWLAGGFNAVFGSLIGEAIILTQPTSSVDDLRAYRAGGFGGGASVGYRTAF